MNLDRHRAKSLIELWRRNSFVLIVGAPFIGKSRLLEELRVHLGTSIDTSFLTHPEPLQLSKSLDELLTTKLSKLMVAMDYIPEIPASLVHRTAIYRFDFCSREEIQSLIPSQLESELERIYQLSEGQPWLAKHLCLQALTGQKLESNHESKRALFELIFENLNPFEQDLLILCAQLKESKSLIASKLRALSPRTSSWLTHFRFLLPRPDQHLSTSARDFLKRISLEKKIDPTRLLAHLQDSEDLNSMKDRLEIELSQRMFSDACLTFERIAKSLYMKADFVHFIKYSEPILNEISAESFLLRRDCLAYSGSQNQALEETEGRLLSAQNLEDRAAFLYAKALCEFSLGSIRPAFDSIEASSSLTQSQSLKKRTELARAFFLTSSQPEEALKICDQLQSEIETEEKDNTQLQAEVYFQKALVYDFLHKKQEALLFYRDSQRLFLAEQNKSKELLCALNIANLEFDVGNAIGFRRQIELVEKESRRLQLNYLTKICAVSQSIYSAARGKNKEAIHTIRRNLNLRDGLKSRIDYLLIRRLIFIHLLSGDFYLAREYSGLALNQTLKKRLPQDYLAIKFLSELIDVSLLKNFYRLSEIGDRIIASDFSPSIQMGLIISTLEINRQHFFPASVRRILQRLEDLLIEGHEIDRLVHLKIIGALYYILNRQNLRALELLREAEAASREAGFDEYLYRSLVYLSLVHISENRFSVALQKINEAKTKISEASSWQDKELLGFAECLCYHANHDTSNFENALSQLASSSYPRLRLEKMTGLSPSKHEEQSFESNFYDQLLDSLGIQSRHLVYVSTSKQRHIFHKEMLSRHSFEKYQLVLDEIKGQVILGKKKWSFPKGGLLTELLKYFLKNAGKSISKEELCLRVWNEAYHPLVHDQRIYTAIRRLRLFLQDKNAISEMDGRYRISNIKDFAVISDREEDLNDRQSWILQFIENTGSANRTSLQRALQISASSCKNDLRELIRNKKIESYGSGRNTRYRRI